VKSAKKFKYGHWESTRQSKEHSFEHIIRNSMGEDSITTGGPAKLDVSVEKGVGIHTISPESPPSNVELMSGKKRVITEPDDLETL